jgi:hypothetical protein
MRVMVVPVMVMLVMIVVRHGKASKKHWNFDVGPQIGVPATGRSRGKKHDRRRRKNPPERDSRRVAKILDDPLNAAS